MKRLLLTGMLVAVAALSLMAIGCGDDENGDEPGNIATPTEVVDGGETPAEPTEPLGLELPPDAIDAVREYVIEGNVQSFPAVTEIETASACTTAGQVCYDLDESTWNETSAAVRVYSYASDDIQDVALELQDGEWIVTGHAPATP